MVTTNSSSNSSKIRHEKVQQLVCPFTAIQVKTCSKQKQTITLSRFKSLPCNLNQTKQTENNILS